MKKNSVAEVGAENVATVIVPEGVCLTVRCAARFHVVILVVVLADGGRPTSLSVTFAKTARRPVSHAHRCDCSENRQSGTRGVRPLADSGGTRRA